MKRIVLLFVIVLSIVLSIFFSGGELFAEDIDNNIGYNIEDNIDNNIGYNLENNVDNNIGYNIENNIENNTSKAIEEIKEIKEIKEDTNNTIEKPKPSLNDIFGDDQTFPFVAGFGKD